MHLPTSASIGISIQMPTGIFFIFFNYSSDMKYNSCTILTQKQQS